MHTQMVDENGTDLPAVVEALCPDYDVAFTNVRLEQNILNEIYNLVDCTINIANVVQIPYHICHIKEQNLQNFLLFP